MARFALEETLERIAPQALETHGVPGLAVGVIDGAEEVVRCFGIEELGRPTPVTEDTLFQVGSIAKSLTAILVQQLIHEGRLLLDEPVLTYVPELELADANVTATVTCRHLLAHLSGFEGDHFIDTGDGPDALELYVATLKGAPQAVPFDWRFSYSNAGYAVLGRVIEVLRGVSYEDAARSLVLDPLALRRTGFAWETPSPPVASGHVLHDELRVVRPWRLFRNYAAWGGLVTNLHDFLRYSRFFLGQSGHPVLPGDQREHMWEPLSDPAKSRAAMGWPQSPVLMGGQRVVIGGGSAVSQHATHVVVPDADFSIITLTNGDQGPLVIREIVHTVLAQRFGIDPPTPTHVQLSSGRPAQYVGSYRAGIYAVEVGLDEEGLWLEADRLGGMDSHQSPRPAPLPRMRLDFVADDRALIRNGPGGVSFARDHTGRVGWVSFYGRLSPRVGPLGR